MNNFQSPVINLPQEFAGPAIELFDSLVPSTALSFYFIDPQMHLRGFVGVNVDSGINEQYRKQFWHLDPLHPRNYQNSEERVVCSNELMSRGKWMQTIFYQDFFKPRGFMHCADIFFRNEGKIVAALLSVRNEQLGEYLPHELKVLENIQRFLEFSLNKIYIPPRAAERRYVAGRYGLTNRELDVLECVMSGLSNKAACEELNMRLPTLRTHLNNLFSKVGVATSNELISQVFRELLNERDSLQLSKQ